MVTIKSYTDLEQSRKLAEILPFESADMCYPLPCKDGDKPLLEQGGFGSTPCWSLAALIDNIPQMELDNIKQYDKKLWRCCAYFVSDWYNSDWYDKPIDACCEMIFKLHELNLL